MKISHKTLLNISYYLCIKDGYIKALFKINHNFFFWKFINVYNRENIELYSCIENNTVKSYCSLASPQPKKK